MADYKELLRRAISALPENNGAARRAVYEKARAALVGQLRAITPPLPARDITQHRLQLEDCIRQVEQEASEAVISLSRDINMSARPAAPEAVAPVAAPVVPTAAPAPVAPTAVEPPKSVEVPKPVEAPKTAAGSIEDIINQAAASSSASVVSIIPKPAEPKPEVRDERPLPSIVARAEAAKSGPTSSISSGAARQADSPLKAPSFTPRREPTPLAANSSETVRLTSRMEPSLGNQALARQQVVMPLAVVDAPPVEAALSAVREVEVEPDPREAEGAIERAIETLDREARGEVTAPLATPLTNVTPGTAARKGTVEADDDASDVSFAAAPPGGRSGAGLTIFLVVFVLLLAGVGGGGFWAWREGYVDLDQMFGRATTTPQVAVVPPADNTAPTLDTNETPVPVADNAAGPGNTATTGGTDVPTTALEGLEIQDRLEPTPQPVVPNANQTALPQLSGDEVKGEERLPDEDTAVAPSNDLTASVDPAVLAGSQSLLLEASSDGRTGAVPFSGTIEWTEGVDEVGLPTLVGKANIPARNLGISMTIRKNADPSLPASHLMEVDFSVNDTFVGGTIAGLPGVLLKNEELVPGTPLVGASARVVGNSFLFALSASPSDAATNTDLLEHRKWMDLAVIYGTGRNAIITLEKDDAAQALFDKVFAAWAKPTT
jgi:hypothetical protein